MAQFATITGWGKCMPPAVLTNADLATFLDTDDEWIRTRTGIHERRVSHVSLGEMGYVAACRALAGAGLGAVGAAASGGDALVGAPLPPTGTIPGAAPPGAKANSRSSTIDRPAYASGANVSSWRPCSAKL